MLMLGGNAVAQAAVASFLRQRRHELSDLSS